MVCIHKETENVASGDQICVNSVYQCNDQLLCFVCLKYPCNSCRATRALKAVTYIYNICIDNTV